MYHLRKSTWAWKGNTRSGAQATQATHPLAKLLASHCARERQVLDLFLRPVYVDKDTDTFLP